MTIVSGTRGNIEFSKKLKRRLTMAQPWMPGVGTNRSIRLILLGSRHLRIR